MKNSRMPSTWTRPCWPSTCRARPYAEVLLAEEEGEVVGFALFFHNYSTFRGKPGIYLEDLFVLPDKRGAGHGKALLTELAPWRCPQLRPLGVGGA